MHSAPAPRKQLLTDLAELKGLITKYHPKTELKEDTLTAAKFFTAGIQPLLTAIQQLKQPEADFKTPEDINLNTTGNELLKEILALENLITTAEEQDIPKINAAIAKPLNAALSPFAKLQGTPLASQILKFTDTKDTLRAGATAKIFQDKTKDPHFWRGKMLADFGFNCEIKNVGDPEKKEYLSPAVIHQHLANVKIFLESKRPQMREKNELRNILKCAEKIDYAPLYRKELNTEEQKAIWGGRDVVMDFLKHAIYFGNAELVDWMLMKFATILQHQQYSIHNYTIESGNTQMQKLLAKHQISSIGGAIALVRFTPEEKQQAVLEAYPFLLFDKEKILDDDVNLIIAMGNLSMIKNLFEHLKIAPKFQHFLFAISSRNQECIDYVYNYTKDLLTSENEKENKKKQVEIIRTICATGNESLFNKFRHMFDPNNEEMKQSIPPAVADSENTKFAIYLFAELKVVPDDNVLRNAIFSANVDLVMHLLQNYKFPMLENQMQYKYALLPIVAQSQSPDLILYFAVDLNHPEVLENIRNPMIRAWMKEQVDERLKLKNSAASSP